MQSSVFAFVVVDMDGNFLDQAQRLAASGFESFEIGPEDVVGFAGGNALGELAHVVGVDFPLRLFVLGAADFHRDTIDGAIVRTPDRPGDESVGLAFGLRGCEESLLRTEGRQEKYDQEKGKGRQPCDKAQQTKSRSSHRLRFPPPHLLPLRSLLPRLSTQADW